MANEYRTIFSDEGVVLVLMFALFIYATTYSLAYAPEVLHDVPIGVVDLSQTSTQPPADRGFRRRAEYLRGLSARRHGGRQKLFFNRDIYGVVYIPSDYEEKLLGGPQAVVALYGDASYFLMYRQVFQEVVDDDRHTPGAMVEFQRLIGQRSQHPQAQATTQPVIYQSHNHLQPLSGLRAFVMPAIIMVIIQQTMLIGIGMIGGTWREFGLYRKLCPAGRRPHVHAAHRLGTRTGLRVALRRDVFLHPRTALSAFHYPMNGATGTILLFMAAYLAACIGWASPCRRCSATARIRCCSCCGLPFRC